MHIVRVIVIVVMDASGLLHDLTVAQSVSRSSPLTPRPLGPLWPVGFMDIANLIGSGHNRALSTAPTLDHILPFSPRANLISTCLIDLGH